MYHKSNTHKVGVRKRFTGEPIYHAVRKIVTLRKGIVKKILNPPPTNPAGGISKEKYADIQSLLKFLSGEDLAYMSSLKVKQCNEPKKKLNPTRLTASCSNVRKNQLEKSVLLRKNIISQRFTWTLTGGVSGHTKLKIFLEF